MSRTAEGVAPRKSNATAVSDALVERLAGRRAILDDRSLATALVAIQGPRAAGIMASLTDVALDGLRYYAIAEGHVFIGSDDAKLHAINALYGRGAWKTECDGPIRSTPLVSGDRIAVTFTRRVLVTANHCGQGRRSAAS